MVADGGGWTLISRMSTDNSVHYFTNAAEDNPPLASYGTDVASVTSGTFGHAKIRAIQGLRSEAGNGMAVFRVVQCADRRYQEFDVLGDFYSDGTNSDFKIRCRFHADNSWSAWYTSYANGDWHKPGLNNNNQANTWMCPVGTHGIKHWTVNFGGIYNAEGGCGDFQGELFIREELEE